MVNLSVDKKVIEAVTKFEEARKGQKSSLKILLEFVPTNNISDAEFCDEIITVLQDTDFLNSIVHEKMIKGVKKCCERNIFAYHDVLKSIDCGDCTTSYFAC